MSISACLLGSPDVCGNILSTGDQLSMSCDFHTIQAISPVAPWLDVCDFPHC